MASPPKSPEATSPVPKAVLYGQDGAIWTSAVQLALEEKGYGLDEIDYRQVDVVKGENFDLTYLRINPQASVPTLVVPLSKTLGTEIESRYKAITDVKSILEFLDKSRTVISKTHTTSVAPAPALAPATIDHLSISSGIINLVHSPSASVQFLMLSATDPSELAEKAKGFQMTYLSQRNNALQTHLRPRGIDEAPLSTRYKVVLEDHKAKTDAILQVYQQALDPQSPLVNEFLEKSKRAWGVDVKSILDTVEQTLKDSHSTFAGGTEPASVGPDAHSAMQAANNTRDPSSTFESNSAPNTASAGPGEIAYVLGDQLSLADLHLFAWLARLVRLTGGDLSASGLLKVEAKVLAQNTGWSLGNKVKAFWDGMIQRESVKKVYKNGPQ